MIFIQSTEQPKNHCCKKTQRYGLPVGPIKSEKVADNLKYTHGSKSNAKVGNLMATS
jgi:hypothetical protein